jgi:hypothetical protein
MLAQGSPHYAIPQHGALLPFNYCSGCGFAHAGRLQSLSRYFYSFALLVRWINHTMQLFEAAVMELKTAASRQQEHSRL